MTDTLLATPAGARPADLTDRPAQVEGVAPAEQPGAPQTAQAPPSTLRAVPLVSETAQRVAQAIAMGLSPMPNSPQAWEQLASQYTATGALPAMAVVGGNGPSLSITGPTTAPTGELPAQIASPSDFAKVVLSRLGAPITAANVQTLVDWSTAEGGNWHNPDRYNPLNTTMNEAGAVSTNSAGVKSYGSWDQGLDATVSTLKLPAYGRIVSDLMASAPEAETAGAVGQSPWGTPDFYKGGAPAPGSAADHVVAPVRGSSVSAVDYAKSQLGTPYVWGGEAAGRGFDCSGLVQAAFAKAGISLPRTAQEQFDATTKVPNNQPLQPGDLVFFGTSTSNVSHVGIYVGNGQMIDAPHAGASVRVESYKWGDYLGASRPGDATGVSTLPQIATGSDPSQGQVLGRYYTILQQVQAALQQLGGTP